MQAIPYFILAGNRMGRVSGSAILNPTMLNSAAKRHCGVHNFILGSYLNVDMVPTNYESL
jgi:hypothetical protein